MPMVSVRRALVVATGRYDDPDLRRLRSPAQDAPALADVLSDPAIGGYDVTQVIDQPHYRVTAAMEDFFADSRLDDLLLVHLSCHGVKDDDGRLYFAATDTKRRRLASSAVSAVYLNDLMDRCRARSIMVLLDCCYSGAFVAGAKGDEGVHLKERLSGHGRAVLTASNAIEYAWEGDELSGQAEASLFTAAIVDGLTTGDADRDRDGAVSIEDLHKHVYERVREAKRTQTPLLWTFGVAGTLHIAQNPHPPAPATEAPSSEVPAAGEGKAPAGVTTSRPDGRRRWGRRLPQPGRRRVVAAAVALAVVLVAAAVSLWSRDSSDDDNDGVDTVEAGDWSPEAPAGIAVDDEGGLYVAESGANVVTYFEDHNVNTFAGGDDDAEDEAGQGDGGSATGASLAEPVGIALSDYGDLYLADRYHSRVRRVTDDATMTPFAGNGGNGSSGDGGPATQAELAEPHGVAVGPDGSVYISDSAANLIRKVTPDGTITTVVGTGDVGSGGDGGPATEAELNHPTGLAVGSDGTVYIADTGNNRIRRVDTNGIITTVAGTGEEGQTGDAVPADTAALALPEGVAVHRTGDLYIADTGNDRIRRVDTDGIITTVAGVGTPGAGGDDGPAIEASLNGPRGIALTSDGTLHIADTGNNRIRRVDTDGTITSL
jgi:sugar lactone lactonase YvrE